MYPQLHLKTFLVIHHVCNLRMNVKLIEICAKSAPIQAVLFAWEVKWGWVQLAIRVIKSVYRIKRLGNRTRSHNNKYLRFTFRVMIVPGKVLKHGILYQKNFLAGRRMWDYKYKGKHVFSWICSKEVAQIVNLSLGSHQNAILNNFAKSYAR